MALILVINTATDEAGVCISENGELLFEARNNNQKEHAAWVLPEIDQLIKQTGKSLHQLSAIAVVAGPGSYTGIRVGMASAKGLCYSLQKPLLVLNTLSVLARAAANKENFPRVENADPFRYVVPMIDARRMEVFTAVFAADLQIMVEPGASILTEHSYNSFLQEGKVLFVGSGVSKWKTFTNHENAVYVENINMTEAAAQLAEMEFSLNNFADIAYSEPIYIKEFYNPHIK